MEFDSPTFFLPLMAIGSNWLIKIKSVVFESRKPLEVGV